MKYESLNLCVLIGIVITPPRCNHRPDGNTITEVILQTYRDTEPKGKKVPMRHVTNHIVVAAGKARSDDLAKAKKGDWVYCVGSYTKRNYTGVDNVERVVAELWATEVRVMSYGV